MNIEKPIKKNRLRGTLSVLALVIFILGSYALGYGVGRGEIVFDGGIIPRVINRDKGKPANVDFSLFWDAWNKVEDNYIGDIDRQKMLYGAIRGMTEALGDPYTVFMDPDEAKIFNEDIEGKFEGIGAEIGIRDDQLTVIAPLPGSPAEKEGLRAKDIIFEIDGKSTEGMSIDDAVSLIRGPKDTKVKIKASHNGEKETFEVEVTRDIIEVKSVQYEKKENGASYIAVRSFDENTGDEFRKAVNETLANNSTGLVLDLRDDPGGFLDTALNVGRDFLSSGLVAVEEQKDGKREEYKVDNPGRLTTIKLVVLINGGSASGAEIVAGAIQDQKRGILIGEKTFGKGTVQSVEDLTGGALLKITIAKWLTPNGRSINKEGIMPDREIKRTDEDITSGIDPQLDAALEYLRKE